MSDRRALTPPATGAIVAHDAGAAHEAIGRLADDLVPALSAALAASGLAELELREAGWRVRVRRNPEAVDPADADGQPARRRASDRSRGHGAERGRSHEGHDPSTNGTGPGTPRTEPRPARPEPQEPDRFRAVATSPAVGRFRPAGDVPTGSRVRAGDRLGTVDVLGVAQEVNAPADGIVMAILAEADQAVEYGQPLVELERMSGERPAAAFAVGGEE